MRHNLVLAVLAVVFCHFACGSYFKIESFTDVAGKFSELLQKGRDGVALILSDKDIFEGCMKYGSDEQVSRLYVEVFIKGNGSFLMNSCKRNSDDLPSLYYEPFRQRPKLWQAMLRLYRTLGDEDRAKMTTFFKLNSSLYSYCFGYTDKMSFQAIVDSKNRVHSFEMMCIYYTSVAGASFLQQELQSPEVVKQMMRSMLKGELEKCERLQELSLLIAYSNGGIWADLPDLVQSYFKDGQVSVVNLVLMMSQSTKCIDPAGLPDDIDLLSSILNGLTELGAIQCIIEMIRKRPSRNLLTIVLNLSSEVALDIIKRLMMNDKDLDYIIPNMRAIVQSYDIVLSKELREPFKQLVMPNIPSMLQGQSDHGCDLFASLPDDVLRIIFLHASDSIAFSQLILMRVCKRWKEHNVDSKLITINHLGTARHYLKSLMKDDLIMTNDVSFVVAGIFCKWNATELKLSDGEKRFVKTLLPKLVNVKPSDLALVMRNLSNPIGDFKKSLFFHLPRPSTFTSLDTSLLVHAVIKLCDLEVDFGDLGLYCLPLAMVWLEALVVYDSEPEKKQVLLDKIIKQITYPDNVMALKMQHELTGKPSNAIMSRIVSIAEKEFSPSDYDDFDHNDCLWLCFRYHARQIMTGLPGLDYEEMNSLPHLLVAAFIEAENTDQILRLLDCWPAFDGVDMKDLEAAFYEALLMLISGKDFDDISLEF